MDIIYAGYVLYSADITEDKTDDNTLHIYTFFFSYLFWVFIIFFVFFVFSGIKIKQ